jgi:hypothetical protein
MDRWVEGRYHWADIFAELRRIMLVVEEAGKRKFGADVGLWVERFTSDERTAAMSGLFGAPGGMMPPGMGGFAPGAMPPEYDGAPGMPAEMAMPPGAMERYGIGGPNPYAVPVDPYGGAGTVDPMTGQPMIDPNTGQPMDASAGAMEPVIDPATGQPMIDPNTGQPMMQPAAGGAAPPGAKITLVCKAISLSTVNPTANTDIAFALENALKQSTNFFDPQTTGLQGQINVDEEKGIFTFGVNLVLQRPLEF